MIGQAPHPVLRDGPGVIRIPLPSLFFLFALEVVLLALFYQEIMLPAAVLAGAMAVLAGWGLLCLRVTPLSLLARLMILLYYVPFSATLGYLLDADYLWGVTAAAIELELDPLISSSMLHMGLIGLAGLLIGLRCASSVRRDSRLHSPRREVRGSMSLPAYLLAVLLALFFSWLSAPT